MMLTEEQCNLFDERKAIMLDGGADENEVDALALADVLDVLPCPPEFADPMQLELF